MKKLLFLLVSVVAVAAITLSGCFLFEGGEKRGQLDTTGIPVIELGKEETLIRDKAFTASGKIELYDLEFESAAQVKLFRYKAYYNGTYNFSVTPACNVSIYAHTGNIVTDWWEKLPCKQDLYAGLEYSIEIKLNDSAYVGKPLKLKVETPSTQTKDISDCVSFSDEYVKGEKAYYSFTATRNGEHSFTFNGFNGFGRMKYYKNNQQILDTAWATKSINLKKGDNLTIEVTPPKDYNKKIYGIVQQPAIATDITETLKESGCVILEIKPVFYDQQILFSISADEQTQYYVSNAEVGVQCKGKKHSLLHGYGATAFKTGDSWVNNGNLAYRTLTINGGTSATVKINGPGKNDDRKYFLTVWKVGTEMRYLDYSE